MMTRAKEFRREKHAQAEELQRAIRAAALAGGIARQHLTYVLERLIPPERFKMTTTGLTVIDDQGGVIPKMTPQRYFEEMWRSESTARFYTDYVSDPAALDPRALSPQARLTLARKEQATIRGTR
jgi:hypothetical protein